MTDKEQCLALCKTTSLGNPVIEKSCRANCEKQLPEARNKDLEKKKAIINMIYIAVGSIGTIAGWVYANRTGGGFWRYVGYGFMGGLAGSTLAYAVTIPMRANVVAEETK